MLALAAVLGGCGQVARRTATRASASRARQTATRAGGSPRVLERQLKQFLASQRPLAPVRIRVAPPQTPGGVCAVATYTGPCSLRPCQVYVQGQRTQLVAIAGAAVVRSAQPPGRCPPGARPVPQTLRVTTAPVVAVPARRSP